VTSITRLAIEIDNAYWKTFTEETDRSSGVTIIDQRLDLFPALSKAMGVTVPLMARRHDVDASGSTKPSSSKPKIRQAWNPPILCPIKVPATTDQKIEDAAIDSGFGTISRFSDAFCRV
jgi:AraC-like DNA-binding protein